MTRRHKVGKSDEYRRACREMKSLIERFGMAEAVRITSEEASHRGDYTAERLRLLAGMTVDDWMSEMFPGQGRDMIDSAPRPPRGLNPLDRPRRLLLAYWTRTAPTLLEVR